MQIFHQLVICVLTIRPFVHCLHHHHPRRRLMSKILNRDQVEGNRRRLHRRRQRRPTLRPFFIWKGRSHQEQLHMLQRWYVHSTPSQTYSWFLYSSSSICIPPLNGLKSIITSASEASIISSLIFLSLINGPTLFWGGGIGEFCLDGFEIYYWYFPFRQVFPNHVATVVKSRKSRTKLIAQRQARARPDTL